MAKTGKAGPVRAGARAGADVAVTSVASNGIGVRVDGRDYFLPYEDFPWFENADAKAVRTVTRAGEGMLRWPALDVELEVDSLGDPVAGAATPAGPAPRPAAKKKAAAPKPKKAAPKPKRGARR